jgi:hypothetical protein
MLESLWSGCGYCEESGESMSHIGAIERER